MVNAQQLLESQERYNTKEKRELVTELNISNLLTKITFPANPINLKELYLGGCNRLTGSLGFLSNMKNLKVLEIIDNDFDEVDLDKLPRSLEEINYSALRKDCKLTKIIPELDKVKYGFCQKCLKPNISRK
ncbi:5695_t:CDS:2 [Funneliformis geosporum]|nr:5695_t:CDS:2 [Funneliformis geosporum]